MTTSIKPPRHPIWTPLGHRSLDPCPYTHHRWSDWRLQLDAEGTLGERVTCGVCHPPADGVIAIGIDGELVEPELRASRFVARGHLTELQERAA